MPQRACRPLTSSGQASVTTRPVFVFMFEAGELPSWRFIDARSPQFSLPAINHGACSGLWERSPHNLSQENNLLVRSAQLLITGTKLLPKICYRQRICDLPSFNTKQQVLLLENNWVSWQKWCLHNLHVSPWACDMANVHVSEEKGPEKPDKNRFRDERPLLYHLLFYQQRFPEHEKWGCNVQTSFTRHAIHKQRLRFKIWRGKNSLQTSRYDAKQQLNKHEKWKQLT